MASTPWWTRGHCRTAPLFRQTVAATECIVQVRNTCLWHLLEVRETKPLTLGSPLVGLASELGEPKASARELRGVLRWAPIFPRVPATPPRIGSPKGSPKGETGPNDPEGAPQNPADPHSGQSSNPADPHPGQSSNPADQSHWAAPPRIASGDQGESSTQGAGKTPARIASDKPDDHAGTTPESLLMGESKDFNSLPPKGRRLDDEVHRAIRDNEPDVRLPRLTDNYEVRDKVVPGEVASKAQDLVEPFQDFGVDITMARQSSATVHSGGQEGHTVPVVVGGRYYDQHGTIVADKLFAPNDINPETKRMRPSDIVFLQWQEFASHRNTAGRLKHGMRDQVNELKYFVAENIQSRSTIETIVTAHRRTNQAVKEKGVFRRGGEGAQKESFEALLYTPIVASVQHMLRQHHGALGNKRIVEIVTYPRSYDPETRQGRQQVVMTLKLEHWNP